MRKVLVGCGVLAMALSATASAKSRPYCDLRHPNHYYQSLGKRHHGKYGISHYRRYHRLKRRALPRYYRSYQRDYFPYRYRRDPRFYRYDRRRLYRPKFRIYFEF